MQGLSVRRDVARNAANVFLDFLFEVAEGNPVDMSGLNPRIVKLVAARYAVEGATWLDLVDRNSSDSPVGAPENRPEA